jgi:integrase
MARRRARRVVHPRTFAKRFDRLVETAGVRRIVLHGARHTAATLALEAGERADVVAERLGMRPRGRPSTCTPTSTRRRIGGRRRLGRVLDA